jgi:hypothetical protein
VTRRAQRLWSFRFYVLVIERRHLTTVCDPEHFQTVLWRLAYSQNNIRPKEALCGS